jgi:ABC-type uncharacterized transport system ATPase subunit
MSDVRAELHDTLLYLDGVTVSFDGFRALNALSRCWKPVRCAR